MSKRGTFTVDPHIGQSHHSATRGKDPAHPIPPLSGSKKVKNRKHSRENHGEGS